ncbi:hypothetical protein ABKV19_012125 [Rosa sericea]
MEKLLNPYDKEQVEQSEIMVQEICCDIKKLDFLKKHITTTIAAVHCLTMLVDLHENLFEELSNYRQIKTLKICDNLDDRMFRKGEHAAAALQNLTGRLHAGILEASNDEEVALLSEMFS